MVRIALSTLVALLVPNLVAGAEETARQGFVVHVGPKVTFEPPAMIEQTATAAETAVHVSSTGTAGMTVQFESNHPVQVRLAPRASKSWAVSVDQNGKAQASSSGHGHATLLLAMDAELDELEIIATVISKD